MGNYESDTRELFLLLYSIETLGTRICAARLRRGGVGLEVSMLDQPPVEIDRRQLADVLATIDAEQRSGGPCSPEVLEGLRETLTRWSSKLDAAEKKIANAPTVAATKLAPGKKSAALRFDHIGRKKEVSFGELYASTERKRKGKRGLGDDEEIDSCPTRGGAPQPIGAAIDDKIDSVVSEPASTAPLAEMPAIPCPCGRRADFFLVLVYLCDGSPAGPGKPLCESCLRRRPVLSYRSPFAEPDRKWFLMLSDRERNIVRLWRSNPGIADYEIAVEVGYSDHTGVHYARQRIIKKALDELGEQMSMAEIAREVGRPLAELEAASEESARKLAA